MPYISLQRPSLSQLPLTTYPMLTPGGRHLTWAPLPSISATSVNAQPHSFPLAEPPANRVSMRLHDGDNEPEPILPRSEVPVAPIRPWSTPHIPKVATVTHFTPLFDELPPVVRAVQSGWLSSSQSAATVSGLIAATDAQLLVFMRSPADPSDPLVVHHSAREAMIAFIYLGLFFSISATVSQLIMTETLAELPINAARAAVEERAKNSSTTGSQSRPRSVVDRLVRYGTRREFKYVSLHWLFCFLMGILSTVVSVLMYIWIEEPLWIKISMTPIVVFTGLPFLHYLPVCRRRRRRSKLESAEAV